MVEEIMKRFEANMNIIHMLTDYVRAYPDMRFGQILYNMGIATHCLESILTEEGAKVIGTGVALQSIHFVKHNRDIFYEESEDTLKKLIRRNEYTTGDPNETADGV